MFKMLTLFVSLHVKVVERDGKGKKEATTEIWSGDQGQGGTGGRVPASSQELTINS